MPRVGDRFESGEPFGSVESVKAMSEIYVPVSGEVVEVNQTLDDSPEQLNDDPHGDGWVIRIRTNGPASTDGLFDADGYAAMDFVVTADGENGEDDWVYIETNCAGEFGWIEATTQLPISA